MEVTPFVHEDMIRQQTDTERIVTIKLDKFLSWDCGAESRATFELKSNSMIYGPSTTVAARAAVRSTSSRHAARFGVRCEDRRRLRQSLVLHPGHERAR